MSNANGKLEELVQRLQSVAGRNLESVVLYGSAARDDFSEKYSDLNLLCILKDASSAELDKLAPVVQWWSKHLGQRPPLLLTAEEMRASADVYAMEMLDIQASHRILYGRDAIPEIDVPMNLHRLEVEHELRNTLLRLRQHYLLAHEDEQELERVLAKSASQVSALLRHCLIVVGAPIPESRRELVTQAGGQFGVDPAPFLAALDLREERRLQAGVRETYHFYIRGLASLISEIDRAVPKEQWRRVSNSPRPSS
ncbi:MAG TPA: nucleotidyltransferase domain-containing protein [Terriglobales bacterium]|nr:nucleotidyltransferase domain-containing protein [Terriglobales bacterium]